MRIDFVTQGPAQKLCEVFQNISAMSPNEIACPKYELPEKISNDSLDKPLSPKVQEK
jgi:hypothetical protein